MSSFPPRTDPQTVTMALYIGLSLLAVRWRFRVPEEDGVEPRADGCGPKLPWASSWRTRLRFGFRPGWCLRGPSGEDVKLLLGRSPVASRSWCSRRCR